MQKSRSFDLAKNIRLIGLIFAAPSPFKDTCAKKKVTLLGFQASVFQKKYRKVVSRSVLISDMSRLLTPPKT